MKFICLYFNVLSSDYNIISLSKLYAGAVLIKLLLLLWSLNTAICETVCFHANSKYHSLTCRCYCAVATRAIYVYKLDHCLKAVADVYMCIYQSLAYCGTHFYFILRFEVVELPGKRNRKVPLLLKPEWVEIMDMLMSTRQKCAIPDGNTYFFATPTRKTHLNAWQVMVIAL